ncbi:MAG: M23 family metallopeptidase [Ruminococcus sp.]|nr:M23 family metallopeptidase [Ruminococcus sp.]
MHRGYDIAQNRGATIVASRAGTVIAVTTGCSHNYPKSSNCCGNGYGNYVLVSHGDGYSTMYAHMQQVNVSVGQRVSKGQSLGQVGCTGHSTGFHLHFEIRKNGSAVNPKNYLNY